MQITSRWPIWLSYVLASVVAIGLLAGIIFLPAPITQHDLYNAPLPAPVGTESPTPADRLLAAEAVRATRQALLWTAGGIIAVITLWFTWRRDQANREKLQLDRDANYTTRYTEAISQLGSDQLAIRIGGVYALERIAKDSQRDHDVVIQVLAAYIRRDSMKRDVNGGAHRWSSVLEWTKTRGEDVSAAITVVSNLAKDARIYVDLRGVDLREMDLSSMDLRHTKLMFADLSGSDLSDADLSGVPLDRAKLHDVRLTRAKLFATSMVGVDATHATFVRADLSDANLTSAQLSLSNFSKAILDAATLDSACLERAIFVGSSLKGTSFRHSQGISAEMMFLSEWNEDTTWPTGFAPSPR